MSKIGDLIRIYDDAAVPYGKELPTREHFRDTAAALRDLRDRIAEAEKVVELARVIEATSIESYNAKKKVVGEWDEYDEMILPLWENLSSALAAYPPKPASGKEETKA